jgi:hypothetical protein
MGATGGWRRAELRWDVKLMEIQYQCGLQDYLEAQYAHCRRSTAFYVVGACILGFAGILGAYQMITEGYPQGYQLLAFVFLWSLLRFVCRPLWFRRDFRKHPNFAIPQTVRVEEDDVSYKSDLGQGETKWNAFFHDLFGSSIVPRRPEACFRGIAVRRFPATCAAQAAWQVSLRMTQMLIPPSSAPSTLAPAGILFRCW